jgi:hypothetical protein
MSLNALWVYTLGAPDSYKPVKWFLRKKVEQPDY